MRHWKAASASERLEGRLPPLRLEGREEGRQAPPEGREEGRPLPAAAAEEGVPKRLEEMLEGRQPWGRPEGRPACEGAPRLAQPPKHSGSEGGAWSSEAAERFGLERCAAQASAPPASAASWSGGE